MEKAHLVGQAYSGRPLPATEAQPIAVPAQKRTNNEQWQVFVTQELHEEIPEDDLYPRASDPRFAHGQRYSVFIAGRVALGSDCKIPDIVPGATYYYDNTIPRGFFNLAYCKIGTDRSPAYLECVLKLAHHKPNLQLLHVTTGISRHTSLPLIGLGFTLA